MNISKRKLMAGAVAIPLIAIGALFVSLQLSESEERKVTSEISDSDYRTAVRKQTYYLFEQRVKKVGIAHQKPLYDTLSKCGTNIIDIAPASLAKGKLITEVSKEVDLYCASKTLESLNYQQYRDYKKALWPEMTTLTPEERKQFSLGVKFFETLDSEFILYAGEMSTRQVVHLIDETSGLTIFLSEEAKEKISQLGEGKLIDVSFEGTLKELIEKVAINGGLKPIYTKTRVELIPA